MFWRLFKLKRRSRLNPIEETLFRGSNRPHALTHVRIARGSIELTIAPWKEVDGQVTPDHTQTVCARFANARIVNVETYDLDGDGIEPPYDIIGFDCDQVSTGLWSFCCHTDCIEYVFNSEWPVLTFTEKA